jgi:hypothetical protein
LKEFITSSLSQQSTQITETITKNIRKDLEQIATASDENRKDIAQLREEMVTNHEELYYNNSCAIDFTIKLVNDVITNNTNANNFRAKVNKLLIETGADSGYVDVDGYNHQTQPNGKSNQTTYRVNYKSKHNNDSAPYWHLKRAGIIKQTIEA